MAREPIQGNVIVVDDEERVRESIAMALRLAGCAVTQAADGQEALEKAAEAMPDLIISDVNMPRMDGLELLRRLRADPITCAIPVIMLTGNDTTDDVVAGLDLGADDYLAKPFQVPELLARVRSKIERPPVPKEMLPRDRQSGLLNERLFNEEAGREIARTRRGGQTGCLACVALDELPRLKEQFGARVEAEIARQMAALIQADAGRLELAGRDGQGRFTVLMPELSLDAAQQRLEGLSRRIAVHAFSVGSEHARLTPAVGYAAFATGSTSEQICAQAQLALSYAAAQLDLHPMRIAPSMEKAGAPDVTAKPATAARAVRWARLKETLRLPLQIAMTFVIGMIGPFLIYRAWDAIGLDITRGVYLFIVLAILMTAGLMLCEGCLALRRVDPPADPGAPYPAASAIIAAYLPNEAATVIETIEAFLRVKYPAPFQIILAYNTPRDMPVEDTLREIAARDARFLPLRIHGSTSKAQNVNAALAEVSGEFVGVFDADHHPDPDNFTRAWRWLSNGYDVVQGHCLVRNGDASWVARMVAVEFETIYSVSHPGRSRLHGFGIFGGSNGYWKTNLLRQTRMHGFMLTEDIDSSLRVVEAGHKIVSDPYLVSRELAPVTLKALWNQRMRWAQGWFQVSYKHLEPGLRSPHLSVRQKLGMLHLLGWREAFPWIALQVVPILAYWALWQRNHLHWFVPVFVFTTAFTLCSGPGQILFTYRLADSEIRRHKSWFWSYFVVASLFYTGFKNLIGRVANLKEFMRERQWKVTPRTTTKEGDAAR